jgi:hypothetical protein
MKQSKIMPEDSFEKARAAFFGNTKPISTQTAPATGAQTPRNEPIRESAGQLVSAVASS